MVWTAYERRNILGIAVSINFEFEMRNRTSDKCYLFFIEFKINNYCMTSLRFPNSICFHYLLPNMILNTLTNSFLFIFLIFLFFCILKYCQQTVKERELSAIKFHKLSLLCHVISLVPFHSNEPFSSYNSRQNKKKKTEKNRKWFLKEIENHH